MTQPFLFWGGIQYQKKNQRSPRLANGPATRNRHRGTGGQRLLESRLGLCHDVKLWQFETSISSLKSYPFRKRKKIENGKCLHVLQTSSRELLQLGPEALSLRHRFCWSRPRILCGSSRLQKVTSWMWTTTMFSILLYHKKNDKT